MNQDTKPHLKKLYKTDFFQQTRNMHRGDVTKWFGTEPSSANDGFDLGGFLPFAQRGSASLHHLGVRIWYLCLKFRNISFVQSEISRRNHKKPRLIYDYDYASVFQCEHISTHFIRFCISERIRCYVKFYNEICKHILCVFLVWFEIIVVLCCISTNKLSRR